MLTSPTRRWETVIPDSQSPSPMCKQEKDVKPDPYLSYRSASITSSDTSTFGANGSPSHSSHDVDIKPPRFERSRSLSTESKPSTDEMSRSLSSGSSASAEDGSRNSRDPSDMKLEPGVDYRAPWVGDRLQNPPRILGFGPRPQPSPRPPAIRDESLSHFNVDRDRSRAPSPIREEDLPKEEQDDQSMATFGDMPPPRAPLSRTMELDSRKRERSMTASEDGHYPEMDDTASRTRAGSARSELEMQEDRADSGTAEGSQRSSSPQYGEDWLQEGEVAAEEEQGMVEIELEATPETDPGEHPHSSMPLETELTKSSHLQPLPSSPLFFQVGLNRSESRLVFKTSSLAPPPSTMPPIACCPSSTLLLSHLKRALLLSCPRTISRWTTTTPLLPLAPPHLDHLRPRLRLRRLQLPHPNPRWLQLEDSPPLQSASPSSMLRTTIWTTTTRSRTRRAAEDWATSSHLRLTTRRRRRTGPFIAGTSSCWLRRARSFPCKSELPRSTSASELC